MAIHTHYRHRIVYVIAISIVPAFVILGPLIGSPADYRLWDFEWGMLLLVGLLLLEYAWLYLSVSSYRVVFGENDLTVGIRYNPFQKQTLLAYENVVKVRRGGVRGLIRLDSRLGDAVQINAAALQGGPERLLAELERRLPPGVIEPDLPAKVLRRQKADVVGILLTAPLCLCLVLILLPSSIGPGKLHTRIAWRWDARLGRQPYENTFSIAQDGRLWLIVSQGLGGRTFATHLLPDELQLFTLPADLPEHDYPQSLGYDSAGRPWVVFESRVLHWAGNEWQSLPLPIDSSSIVLLDQDSGSLAFNRDNTRLNANSLFQVNWQTGEFQPLPLPADLNAEGELTWRAHILPDQTMLAYFRTQTDQRVYTFSNGTWQSAWYPVIDPSGSRVSDITRDTQGVFWAIGHNPDNQSYLGRFDAQAKQWNWLPIEFCCGSIHYTKAIEVDARGRAWVAAVAETPSIKYLDFVGVYQFGPDNQLAEVVSYSERNSGYRGAILSLGPDGRLWSGAAWIDTNAEHLPRPLPDWLLPLGSKTALYSTGVITTIFSLILAFYEMGRARQYIPRP